MFPPLVHCYIYLFGLFALAFGMMVGTVPTSVPQLILAGNWVIEGRFRIKWQQLRGNVLFWILSSIYLIHVAGVFYSQDTGAALHDIRTKMPLMFLPMVFLTSIPFSDKLIRRVFYFFIAGCVVNTAWCLIYSFVLHDTEVVRNASRFMSHIRLGLYLNMALAASVYYGRKEQGWKKLVLFSLPAYFLFAMVALGLASGLVNFLLLLFLFLAGLLLKSGKRVRFYSLLVLLALGGLLAFYVNRIHDAQLEVKDSPVNIPQQFTPSGSTYLHFDTTGQKENGYYVLMNIEISEIRRCWNRDFPMDSFSYDPPHNLQRYEELLRYMSSKGLMKDSLGYSSLSETDKQNVRNGFTNHLQPGWNFLRRRLYELMNEYDEFLSGRSINGHSFTMRLYFWKAAIHAIQRNPVLGAGNGDVQAEMDKSYIATGSPLEAEWRKRPHNQFLTITLALGVAGLLVFVFMLAAPLQMLKKQVMFLYKPFFVLAIISFLFEDTLETQAGLTFFAFFNTLLLCDAWLRRQQTPGDSPGSR